MADSQLPDAELDVLACLWENGRCTAREVRESMDHYRPMTHSAVCTLLQRLQDKKMVSRKKGPIGKAFVYQATSSAKKMYKQIASDLLRRVFFGKTDIFVKTVLEAGSPSLEELDEIDQAVKELRAKKAKRKRSR